MTEGEWLACTDPERKLIHLSHRTDKFARKLRLFAAACCRAWADLPGEGGRTAVRECERAADRPNLARLERARAAAQAEQHAFGNPVSTLAAGAAAEAASARAWSAAARRRWRRRGA